MSTIEPTRLARLEAVIEKGMRTFVEVGEALQEIRDSRLYRETHGTFEDYCRERWGFSRIHAFRLVQASQVSRALPTGNIPNERVARELAPLRDDPEALAAAWVAATEATPDPSPADVRRAVAHLRADGEPMPKTREWRRARDIEMEVSTVAARAIACDEIADRAAIEYMLTHLGDGEAVERLRADLKEARSRIDRCMRWLAPQ